MFLAWKELKHSKFRYGMMMAIIVLIAWVVFILAGLGNGLSTLSAATLKNLDIEYATYEDIAGSTFVKSIISEDLMEDIAAVDGVENVAAFGSSTAAVGKTDSKDADEKVDIALLGVEPDAFYMPEIVEGSGISTDKPYGVVVNDTLKDEGYEIGDILKVSSSPLELEIVGFVHNETFNHLPSIFALMDTWREYQYAAPDSNNGVENPVQAFFISAPDLDDPTKIDAAVEGTETVSKKAAINGMPGYTAENGTIMMMLAFLIVISAFIIAVFFYVITMQKTQQFGVMKAIGASNGFIGKAIVSQVLILSVVGIAIGVILTYLTAMVFPAGMPFNLETSLVVTYSVVLLVIALLSSIISVRQIVKIDPLTALGRVE